jgi:hypothetical protein
LKKLAREAMPKGPLETVAEVRRLLDPIERGSQGRRQGVQGKADAGFQGQVKPGRFAVPGKIVLSTVDSQS